MPHIVQIRQHFVYNEPTIPDKNSVKLLANDLVSLSKKGHGFIIATQSSRLQKIATKIYEMEIMK